MCTESPQPETQRPNRKTEGGGWGGGNLRKQKSGENLQNKTKQYKNYFQRDENMLYPCNKTKIILKETFRKEMLLKNYFKRTTVSIQHKFET